MGVPFDQNRFPDRGLRIMSQPEIDIGGKTYRIGKLAATTQFHIARKIGPMVPALMGLYFEALNSGKPLHDSLAELVFAAKPFLDGLAALPDEASNYVIAECMLVVHRRDGSLWFPVWSAQANAPMFDDIDLRLLLELTSRVLGVNLGPFIGGWLTGPLGRPSSTESSGPPCPEERTG